MVDFIRLRPGGASISRRPLAPPRSRGQRDKISGWSRGSALRNQQWLQSVDAAAVTGFQLSLSLTVRDCPSTDEWKSTVRAFKARLSRRGLRLMHWVIEWQRRGVPHMHAMCVFDAVVDPSVITNHWLDLTSSWGSSFSGQCVKAVTHVNGWFRYLSKHGSRGLRHYQRSSTNVPLSWRTGTTRMWGHLGRWPTVVTGVHLSQQLAYRIRRAILRVGNGSSARLTSCRASSELSSHSAWVSSVSLWRLIKYYSWLYPSSCHYTIDCREA